VFLKKIGEVDFHQVTQKKKKKKNGGVEGGLQKALRIFNENFAQIRQI
jgi:hypothetical protein